MIDGLPLEAVASRLFDLTEDEQREVERFASSRGYSVEQVNIMFDDEARSAVYCLWRIETSSPIEDYPEQPDLFKPRSFSGVGPDRDAWFIQDRVIGWQENDPLTAAYGVHNYAYYGPNPAFTDEAEHRRIFSEYGSAFLDNQQRAQERAEEAYKAALGDRSDDGGTGRIREDCLPALSVRVAELRRMLETSAEQVARFNAGPLTDWLKVAFEIKLEAGCSESFNHLRARIHLGAHGTLAIPSAWRFFDDANATTAITKAQLSGLGVLLGRREAAILFAVRARDKLSIYERLLKLAALDDDPGSEAALTAFRQDGAESNQARTPQQLAIVLSVREKRLAYIDEVICSAHFAEGSWPEVARVSRERWEWAGLPISEMPAYMKDFNQLGKKIREYRARKRKAR